MSANGSSKSTTHEIKFTKLFINGEFVDSVSGNTFKTIDPATEEVLATVVEGREEDVDLAVKAAREAFDNGPWPRLSGEARRKIMLKFADLIDENADELATLEAGVPDGVINVVNGFGETAGAAISSHMDIDAVIFYVTFTGSTEVGRTVMQAAATSNLKPVSLELGGKSPFIVFDDADVDKAAELALMGNLMNIEGIHDVFVKKLEAMVKGWSMGDPFDLATRHGPQNNKQQYEKVLSCIEHGKKEGATLVTGGKPIGKKGYYIEPTLFTDVTDDMIIAKEEIFGPVISVLKFKTVEEVIKRANATKYGLTSGVMTKNIDIANTVSRSIRAGAVWINCYLALDRDAPHGGYKMSGFGREQGLETLEHYLQVKTVATPIYDSPWL
ncbi:hypothetical protein L1987_70167 [Smallanthus sonchifolius]|uniref:Uncharacterized protein n=1 Tax=Smallanthus sonchifolius TaxID=185202 RepID=A0ACB9AP67_9ASTR|nr:hypothetical protein L1987_70167 [Smallanthus sonchifolius]